MANNKMDVIINCLEGEDFYATFRVIAGHGKFFQLTKSDMKKKYKMGTTILYNSIQKFLWLLNLTIMLPLYVLKGTFAFLSCISFFSIGMGRLMAEGEETKQAIRKLIEQGLQNGTIKPFDRHVLTGGCTGNQALETLE